MLVSAAVLIANTVRMGLFARRKEIGIMKLVGATNWRIRFPFLIEGLVESLFKILDDHKADFIALAGYMKKLPPAFVRRFRHRIANVHPALLPAFGGQGMYGMRVHEAVIASGCKVSGATVHLVDEEYDRGPIVVQKTVAVTHDDTPESLAAKVLAVEHEIFPHALNAFAQGRVKIEEQKAWIQQ